MTAFGSASLPTPHGLLRGGVPYSYYRPAFLALGSSVLLSGEGSVREVIVTEYISAPPATHGAGDWLMRFYGGSLPVDGEDLYVTPVGSVAVVREVYLYNPSDASATASIAFAGVVAAGPVVLGAGEAVRYSGLWVLGEGETITAPIEAGGVVSYLSGVETVLSG